ncbi:MAG: tetratricopeptide repeat protein [Acidobacteriota bacterium]|nr:tetratricopeptide repeat protein [Acidobacteriota bacterium]
MTIREASVMIVSSVVALAAILGGAFYPGPRVVIGVLLAVALGWAVAVRRGQLMLEERVALGFLVWGVVSAAVAAAAPLSAREAVTVWMVTWGLWLVARRTRKSNTHAGLLILTATAVILAFGVMLEAVGLRGLRVGGLLENPNVTASLLVVSLPAVFIIEGRQWWRLAAAAVLTLGLVLTGSRAGLLAMLAVVAVVLPWGRAKMIGLLTGGIGVTAVLLWRFVNQPDVLAWFRPAIWSAVLRLWVSNPLCGVGPGGLVDAAGAVRLLHADHVGQRQYLIAYAESSPLAVLVQTGLVGFLISCGALFIWWRRVHGNRRMSRTMTAALVAMAVISTFHDMLTVDVVLWWWALNIGLMEASADPPTPTNGLSTYSTNGRTVVGLAFSFIVLWGVVQPAWARWIWRSGGPDPVVAARTMRAEPWFDAPLEWQTRELLKQGQWGWETVAEATAVSGEAVRVHPGAARLWSNRGMVHARVVAEFGPWPDSVNGAREGFARAIELEPHQPWSFLEWARFERNLGNGDDAVNLVRRALDEEPHTVRARLFLARLELDRGEVEAAREAYDAAVESVRLRTRLDLNAYERELLSAPTWQFLELAEALR